MEEITVTNDKTLTESYESIVVSVDDADNNRKVIQTVKYIVNNQFSTIRITGKLPSLTNHLYLQLSSNAYVIVRNPVFTVDNTIVECVSSVEYGVDQSRYFVSDRKNYHITINLPHVLPKNQFLVELDILASLTPDINLSLLDALQLELSKATRAYQQKLGKYKINTQILDERSSFYEVHYPAAIAARDAATNAYSSISKSFFWRITKPVRFIVDALKRTTKLPTLLKKFFMTVRVEGLKSSVFKTMNFIRKNNIAESLSIEEDTRETPPPYVSEYQYNQDFSNHFTTTKALAFYLPQFHEMEENNLWWGEGFTEWDNTVKAEPRFQGHYQPRTPHKDIGYYDLSNVETLKKQVLLAKEHGIYGFCYYYYWFSGKRLLEKPCDILLEHPEIDMPFCICWANENWTRTWDGQDNDVIMKQEYSDEDPEKFISDLEKYVKDRRYIKINDKPVIIVYNLSELENSEKLFYKWRKKAKDIGIGDILIWTCRTADTNAQLLGITDFIDAEVQFPPHCTWNHNMVMDNIDVQNKTANIFNYQAVVENSIKEIIANKYRKSSTPLYLSSMMGWDNAARRDDNWTTFYGYDLESFHKWTSFIVDDSLNKAEEERFVFINAWNEWAEGTYLEPDETYGYANINTFSKGLLRLPLDTNLSVTPKTTLLLTKANQRIAIQIHLYYTESVNEIIEMLNLMPCVYDCYVSTNTESKARYLRMKLNKLKKCNNLSVEVYENRGRDVAPFLMQMSSCYSNYDVIAHIHGKKTTTSVYGEDWRKYLYKHLFGSEQNIINILNQLDSSDDIGLVFPDTYPPLLKQNCWGGNKEVAQILLQSIGIDSAIERAPVFPIGNMFWAKTDAIKDIFNYKWSSSDFPVESGQLNLTIAHAIERSWVYIARSNQYNFLNTYNNSFSLPIKQKKRIAFFVHYNAEDKLDPCDEFHIKSLAALADELILISNSFLSEEDTKKVSKYTQQIIIRENEGYDFGAWKEALVSYGYHKLSAFDELILVNNSVYGPIYDLKEMFHTMEEKNSDFWGITVFPEHNDGTYIDRPNIPEHLQSYFLVFNKSVVLSESFKDFWGNLGKNDTLKDAISNGEVELTSHLSNDGFTYNAYINETYYLSDMLQNHSIPYTYPYELAMLGSPYIKKKSLDHVSYNTHFKIEALLEQTTHTKLSIPPISTYN